MMKRAVLVAAVLMAGCMPPPPPAPSVPKEKPSFATKPGSLKGHLGDDAPPAAVPPKKNIPMH
jgi:hypothetical protein